MQSIKAFRSIFASALCGVALMPALASAADLGGPRGRDLDPMYEPQSAVHRHFYVRADVGIGRHRYSGLSQSELAANGGSFLTHAIDDTVFVAAGVGAKISQRLRLDLTGEYRGTAGLRALDNVTATLTSPVGTLQANTQYTGTMSAYVGMLNGYWDLFSHRGMTPYIGAGIGVAHIRAGEFVTATSATFTDPTGATILELTNGYSRGTSRTNFAWALMAGSSFDITANSKLDIGYRYLNLGSGVTLASGLIDCVCGTVGSPLQVKDIVSHELRVGIRVALDAPRQDVSVRPMK